MDGKPISKSVTDKWSTFEWVYFLRFLPEKMPVEKLRELDDEFHFTESTNSEIQAEWYSMAIRNNYKEANPYIEKFLINVGRRKFLEPIYSELVKTPEGKRFAMEVYMKARRNYHFVSVNTLDDLLGVKKTSIQL